MSLKTWVYSLGSIGLCAGLWYLGAPAKMSAAYTIRCSSDDGGRHLCPANVGRGVRLVRQASQSPCIQGRTWGWDRRGIWVDRGCRADFEVMGGGGHGPAVGPGPGPGPAAVISCSSDDMRRHFCGIPGGGRSNVRLVRQRSDSPCRRGYSWGVARNSIWVDHGCRADFAVR